MSPSQTISVGLAVGDVAEQQPILATHSSIAARIAVSVKFAGAISGVRRRGTVSVGKRRRARDVPAIVRRLRLCRGCAWRLCQRRYLSDLPSVSGQ